ncbi:MAG: 50S ribosomal protein L18 [Flavobacteriales bacterium]|jgi:large subunit ribosomal protein L18|nr:50S ribosomal protein L18 [Flavobacteriales bacterium]
MATKNRRDKIKKRIRSTVSGSSTRPRMSVFRSNKEIYVQLVDDLEGKTLLAAASSDKGIADAKGTKTERAVMVGKLIAERAKEAGYENVVFDRNGYLYHGRVKALAEGAREEGLKF